MLYRDTWAQINLDNLSYNYLSIKKTINKELFCVLKANAYGHGDYQVARTLQQIGCSYVAVSSVDEAMTLRRNGYTNNILILGYVKKENIKLLIEENITMTVTSLLGLIELNDISLEGLKVHIKIDTGMNRFGLKNIQDINSAFTLLKCKNAIIEGIFTHYHSADSIDKTSCERQCKWFYHIVDQLNYKFKWIHTCNSDATLSFLDERSNAVRVGLVLYGVKSIPSEIDVRPVLSLYSKIACIKKVKATETIGYGATYSCDEDEIIATIPIGYGDGFITTNKGRFVSIEGRACQIVGKVCMDLCMIKVPEMYNIGTKVEIIGEFTSVEDMGRQLNVIPYEVLCLLNDRVPRVFMKNNQEIEVINLRVDK